MGDSDSPSAVPLRSARRSTRRYRSRLTTRPETTGSLGFLGDLWTRATLSDSGGTSTPSLGGRPQVRGVAVAGGFRQGAGASILTISRCLAASRRLGAAATNLHGGDSPRRSFSRSSITWLTASLSTLRSLPSRSRGRPTTQDSLPAGGQPLPDGGRNPARSRVKFQLRLHGILLTQAFPTQAGGMTAASRPDASEVAEDTARRCALFSHRPQGRHRPPADSSQAAASFPPPPQSSGIQTAPA
jgi:hypothetical protein